MQPSTIFSSTANIQFTGLSFMLMSGIVVAILVYWFMKRKQNESVIDDDWLDEDQ